MTCISIFFLFLVISCGSANTTSIGKNIDPEVTNLSNVKTYNWTTDIDKIPDQRVFVSETGVYFYNNSSARKRIKDAIEYELNSRGYKMDSSAEKPGMLVSFFVLERADTLRKTSGYINIYGQPVITEKDVEMVPVEPGTLIINIVDTDVNKMVWQGFASGILKPGDINNELKIRQAVSSIFSRFNYDAK